MKYFSDTNPDAVNTLEIRTATDDREVFTIRRFFRHPLYVSGQYYYDLAILELGKQTKNTFHIYATNVHRYILFLKYFSDRKVLYDYEKYGDSPTCLNREFDIQNKDALAQGFGVTDNQESNLKDVDNAQLYG